MKLCFRFFICFRNSCCFHETANKITCGDFELYEYCMCMCILTTYYVKLVNLYFSLPHWFKFFTSVFKYHLFRVIGRRVHLFLPWKTYIWIAFLLMICKCIHWKHIADKFEFPLNLSIHLLTILHILLLNRYVLYCLHNIMSTKRKTFEFKESTRNSIQWTSQMSLNIILEFSLLFVLLSKYFNWAFNTKFLSGKLCVIINGRILLNWAKYYYIQMLHNFRFIKYEKL